jgi:hypothetical protein
MRGGMADKELYKQFKLAGFLLTIPLMLVAAPVGAFFIGSVLERRFGWVYAVPVVLSLFVIATLLEIVRILKKIVRLTKE